MSKTVRSLLVIIGLLLFAVGFLVGQGRRSKFNKYSGPATAMDVGVLRANARVMKTSMSIDIPLIYYNYSCDCFIGYSTITSEMMEEPATQLRARMLASAGIARSALEVEFPEMSKSGTVPDHDFKMTFYELDMKNPDASHQFADFIDGRIVFR